MKTRRAIVVLLILLMSKAMFAESLGWSVIDRKIHSDFPEVGRITTAELASWLANGKRERPVLLDVRTSPEFAISHLRNAVNIQPGSDPKVLSIDKEKPIVTYCSVGYRSAAMAKKLREAGYDHVLNLEGSIFEWANEGRPLVGPDGAPTDKVHPYNWLWGQLLDKSHHAVIPPAPKK